MASAVLQPTTEDAGSLREQLRRRKAEINAALLAPGKPTRSVSAGRCGAWRATSTPR